MNEEAKADEIIKEISNLLQKMAIIIFVEGGEDKIYPDIPNIFNNCQKLMDLLVEYPLETTELVSNLSREDYIRLAIFFKTFCPEGEVKIHFEEASTINEALAKDEIISNN